MSRRQPNGPDVAQHRMHMRMTECSTGTPVPYSPETNTFAPFRGQAVCVDRIGYRRKFHSYDRDYVCVFCDYRWTLERG